MKKNCRQLNVNKDIGWIDKRPLNILQNSIFWLWEWKHESGRGDYNLFLTNSSLVKVTVNVWSEILPVKAKVWKSLIEQYWRYFWDQWTRGKGGHQRFSKINSSKNVWSTKSLNVNSFFRLLGNTMKTEYKSYVLSIIYFSLKSTRIVFSLLFSL